MFFVIDFLAKIREENSNFWNFKLKFYYNNSKIKLIKDYDDIYFYPEA